MGRKGKGRTVKRNKAVKEDKDEEYSKAPHSIVFNKSSKKVGKSVNELTADFRKVMEPFTASNVKVRPKNVVKDFVHVAGMLNVSHLVMFTKTKVGPYLKLATLPRGPTLTFKIKDYTLARDVRSSLKKQITYDKQFQNHALLVMTNLSGEENHLNLMSTAFQYMFPSINPTKVKLNSVRRCVLINQQKETGEIDFRHYTVKTVPVGMSKSIKKLVQGKVPNLARFDDVADFVSNNPALSESEFEDDEDTKVIMPEKNGVASRGNMSAQQSSVRLVELGPRMTLELIKVEEGLFEGDVLYHKLVQKTPEEKARIRATRDKRKHEREKRKKEQMANVKRKAEEKERLKKKSLDGMRKKRKMAREGEESESDESDSAYYEKEIGKKPEKELFDTSGNGRKRRKSSSSSSVPGKLMKRVKKNQESKSPAKFTAKRGKVRKEPRVFNKQGVGPNFTRINKGPKVQNSKKRRK